MYIHTYIHTYIRRGCECGGESGLPGGAGSVDSAGDRPGGPGGLRRVHGLQSRRVQEAAGHPTLVFSRYCSYLYVCMYVYMYTCMYVYMYVCMYVCK